MARYVMDILCRRPGPLDSRELEVETDEDAIREAAAVFRQPEGRSQRRRIQAAKSDPEKRPNLLRALPRQDLNCVTRQGSDARYGGA